MSAEYGDTLSIARGKALKLDTACCGCLGKVESAPNGLDLQELWELFQRFTGIQLTIETHDTVLLRQFCQTCVLLLKSFNAFIERAKSINNLLKSIKIPQGTPSKSHQSDDKKVSILHKDDDKVSFNQGNNKELFNHDNNKELFNHTINKQNHSNDSVFSVSEDESSDVDSHSDEMFLDIDDDSQTCEENWLDDDDLQNYEQNTGNINKNKTSDKKNEEKQKIFIKKHEDLSIAKVWLEDDNGTRHNQKNKQSDSNSYTKKDPITITNGKYRRKNENKTNIIEILDEDYVDDCLLGDDKNNSSLKIVSEKQVNIKIQPEQYSKVSQINRKLKLAKIKGPSKMLPIQKIQSSKNYQLIQILHKKLQSAHKTRLTKNAQPSSNVPLSQIIRNKLQPTNKTHQNSNVLLSQILRNKLQSTNKTNPSNNIQSSHKDLQIKKDHNFLVKKTPHNNVVLSSAKIESSNNCQANNEIESRSNVQASKGINSSNQVEASTGTEASKGTEASNNFQASNGLEPSNNALANRKIEPNDKVQSGDKRVFTKNLILGTISKLCNICKIRNDPELSEENKQEMETLLSKQQYTPESEEDKGRSYECPVCMLKLNSHGQRVFQCKFCEKRFQKNSSRIYHIEIEHKYKDVIFYCDQCPQYFKLKTALRRHKFLKHSTEITPFTCHVCGKGYRSQYFLQRHEKRHLEARPKQAFVCSLCAHTTNCIGNLKSHMAHMHSTADDKQFECDHCGSRFKTKPAVHNHIQSHAGEAAKKLRCPICDKAFRNITFLKKHMSTHEEPNVECPLCPKLFSAKYKVTRHLIAVHKHIPDKTIC